LGIFVTGATGFIGRRLVETLLTQKEKIHILCRSSSDISGLDHPQLNIFRGSLSNVNDISQAILGCNQVYHLAALAKNWAPDPSVFDEVNVAGTNHILEAAKKHSVEKVVITSTSMTFKPSGQNPVHEADGRAEHILTDYARSKVKSEDSAMTYVDRGLSVVFVNPTRVFGPGLMTEGNSATLMIDLYIQGKWRFILGDGSAIGNYGFVDDIVSGHILAMKNGRSGERYILGGENLSYNQFFEVLSDISNKYYRIFHIPQSLVMLVSKMELIRAKYLRGYPLITPEWVEVFSKHWAFSCKKAEDELGYRITPFREAIGKTLDWIRNTN
jgi:farnesol dehydrogenase